MGENISDTIYQSRTFEKDQNKGTTGEKNSFLCFVFNQLLSVVSPVLCWKHITWPVTNRNTTTPVKALSLANCYFAEMEPPWMDHPLILGNHRRFELFIQGNNW